MFTERLWEGGEVPLNVATVPASAPPLLLLHGIGRRWRSFDPILSSLLPNWQLIALDHRGHGRSGRATSYFVADYVRDAAAFVRDGTPGPAVIYGHCLGALTALALASEMPDRVRAIVLEDPPSSGFLSRIHSTVLNSVYSTGQTLIGSGRSVAEVTRELAKARVSVGGVRQEMGEVRDHLFLRFAARCLADLDPEAITPFLDGQWLTGMDLDALTETITCPVLLLRADEAQGGMLPREDADRLAGRLTDCVHVEMPKVGHNIHWLDTETLLRHVHGFLGSL